MVSVAPSETSESPEQAPIVMFKRVTPGSERERVTALPEQFRDSPEVVEELSEGGVDFAAGPTDLKLEGRILSTGQAAWVTYYWNAERTVEFGRRPAKTSFEADGPRP